jgi:hypothetical protein
MIVLGGGMIEALDFYMLPLIKKSFSEHVLNDSAKGLKIVASASLVMMQLYLEVLHLLKSFLV